MTADVRRHRERDVPHRRRDPEHQQRAEHIEARDDHIGRPHAEDREHAGAGERAGDARRVASWCARCSSRRSAGRTAWSRPPARCARRDPRDGPPISVAMISTMIGVTAPGRRMSSGRGAAARRSRACRSARCDARCGRRSRPSVGAISVPRYCSAPNTVSHSTEPVSTSTYQPRIRFSISNAHEVSSRRATGTGSSDPERREIDSAARRAGRPPPPCVDAF